MFSLALQPSEPSRFVISRFTEIFANEETCDNLDLTSLHRIILGMISVDLATQLELSAAKISTPDAEGKPPLMWAARREILKAYEYFSNGELTWKTLIDRCADLSIRQSLMQMMNVSVFSSKPEQGLQSQMMWRPTDSQHIFLSLQSRQKY
jgi:hypothetical protein